MSEHEPVLEAKDVTIELSGEIILRDVNLKVFAGDTIVIIGPSGSGKTVLLKTLAGLYTPTQGTVKCHNFKWTEMSMAYKHDFARILGMQFQKGALFDDLSSIDNVKYALREHTDMSEEEIEDRALECLAMVHLENARSLLPHKLSGGMRLRLGVARSLALKPEILFMDDPTAGLDPVNSDEMAELILSIKQQMNATLVVVTHDIMRAYQFAGRIVFIAGKSLLETGSAAVTRQHPDPRVQQFLHGWLQGPLSPEIMG